MPLRFVLRRVGIVSALCLAALSVAYYLTNEPSAAVSVRWREGLSSERRAELERRHLLVYQEDLQKGWVRYDLLDTGRSNIAALVNNPDIAETTAIDRETMSVPFHAEYGKSWVWVAHRTPGLRQSWVRRSVIGGLMLLTLLALLVSSRVPASSSTPSASPRQ